MWFEDISLCFYSLKYIRIHTLYTVVKCYRPSILRFQVNYDCDLGRCSEITLNGFVMNPKRTMTIGVEYYQQQRWPLQYKRLFGWRRTSYINNCLAETKRLSSKHMVSQWIPVKEVHYIC